MFFFKFQDIDDDVFQDSSEQEPRENRESKVPLKASFARNTSGRSSWSKLFRLGNKSSSAHPRSHRVQEEHIKRKLRVSITDIDEQFQMEDFVNKFCPKYRQGKPFVFDHCCMNTSLGRSNYGINSGCDIMCPIDESRIIIPSFQSTETIYSLMTNNRTSRGKQLLNHFLLSPALGERNSTSFPRFLFYAPAPHLKERRRETLGTRLSEIFLKGRDS